MPARLHLDQLDISTLAEFVDQHDAPGAYVNPSNGEWRPAFEDAWDSDDERLVVEAQAQVPDDENPEDTLLGEDDEEGPPLLRVRLTGAMARAFAKRALLVVAAGRPPCPFCGLPMDADGHICPRANGYRR